MFPRGRLSFILGSLFLIPLSVNGAAVSFGEERQNGEEARPLVLKTLQMDEAIELALKHNPEVKAALAELGIAQAEFRQAGLVENPELSVTLGVGTESPHFLPKGSISQNFLDFFLVDLRKKAARSALKESELAASNQVLEFIFRVKEAYLRLQGAEQFRQQLRTIAETSQISTNLAQKLYDAGNVNLLEVNANRLVAETAQIELTKAEAEIANARESLLGLIGLRAGEIEFKKLPKLPSLPPSERPLEELEKLALGQRLDLQAAKQRIETLEKDFELAKRRFLSHFNFGLSVEREDSGEPVIGPEISVPLPVSDRNQAQKSKIQAQLIQSRYQVSSIERRILTEVRSSHVQVMESRKIARRYQTHILPLLKKTIDETQRHYNFMLKSPFDLLQSKKEEINANRSYIETLRDYWIERARLERAIGARFETADPLAVKK